MTIFDLLFIFVIFVTVAVLIAVVTQVLLGRLKRAGKLLSFYGIGLAFYIGVLVAVSIASPQRVLAMQENRCFDDWCIAVEDVTLAHELGHDEYLAKANGVFYIVTLRLSNQARGRDQRASSAAVHLLDSQRQTYNISPQGQKAFEAQLGSTSSLTSTMAVGQSIIVVQVFDLPSDSHEIALTVEHPVGPAPGLFVIGDDASLFHKPTIVRLP